jgi:hypothetical protein
MTNSFKEVWEMWTIYSLNVNFYLNYSICFMIHSNMSLHHMLLNKTNTSIALRSVIDK